MLTLKCDCCGFEQDFTDAEDAFNIGWDAPPHFTGYVACNLCPASFIVLNMKDKHGGIHEKWQHEGRPPTFSMEDCIEPEDRISPKQLKAVEDFAKSASAAAFVQAIRDEREGRNG